MNENIHTCDNGTRSNPTSTNNTVYGKLIFLLNIKAIHETNIKNKTERV